MTRHEQERLLTAVILARTDAERALAQLRSIEQSLREEIMPLTTAAMRSKADVPAAALEGSVVPPDQWLQGVRCPKCEAAMVWRWSRANGEWFAGCSAFNARAGCRGSRSYVAVQQAGGWETSAPAQEATVEEPPHSAEGPMAPSAYDAEVIEKHHGTEAAANFFDKINGIIPF